MPVPLEQDVEHYRGDTLTLVVNVWDDEDATIAADLSASIVTAQVRPSAASQNLIAEFDVDITDNEITLRLPTKSAQLLPAKAAYDVQVDFYGDESRVQTVVFGALTAQADVTR